MKKPSTKALKLNTAQLRSIMMGARETYNFWGRGQGKTRGTGFVAKKVAIAMPRGKAAIVHRTLIDLKALVVPEMINAWESLGYKENVHYVLGKRPPKKLGFAEPYQRPLDYTHFISWYNGFGFHLVGQDRKGTFRGPSVDFVIPEEMLTIKKDHYEEEVLGANRGNKHVFGHLPFHHGIWANSSKPVGVSDQWILDFGNYYKEDGINHQVILDELVELELDFIDTKDLKRRKKLWLDITRLMEQLIYYPKEGVFYNECRVWNNLKNLGWNWLKNERRVMHVYKFMVEILNHTLKKVQGGFYGNLKLHHHAYYDGYNYDHIDKLGFKSDKLRLKSCVFDKDHATKQPIIIGQDWGASINCIVVAQQHDRELRFINEFFVKHPKILDDVVRDFCNYYRSHSKKHLIYYYDHTGNNRQANSKLTMAQQAAEIFIKNGWTIDFMTTGPALDPDQKYLLINTLLREEDPNSIYIRINGNNCPHLLTSMQLAPVKQGSIGIKKNKSSEREDSGVEQEDATHFSDAFDIPVCGQANVLAYSLDSIPDPSFAR